MPHKFMDSLVELPALPWIQFIDKVDIKYVQ